MVMPVKTFDQMVSDMVTGWAADLGLNPSLFDGDPLLAIMKSIATQGLFLQALAVAINKFARASTAVGADLDSWMADFNFPRNAASFAQGTIQLTIRNARTTNTLISPGVIVQTAGGAIQYQVIADTLQPAFNAAQNCYILVAGTTSVNVTAVALVAGSASNVQINQLSQLSSTQVGIDGVSNNTAILNGQDIESDAAYRNRFILYINSLSKATRPAILSAALGQQGVVNVNPIEVTDQNGNPRNGYFTTVIDDGSGSPPSSLVATVQAAVDAVRGFTIQQTTVGPTKVNVNILMNIRVASGYTAQVVQNTVQAAIVNYINSLQIGSSLYLNKLTQIAIDSSPGVVSVQPSSVTINGVQSDLTATQFQVIRTILGNVSIGTY